MRKDLKQWCHKKYFLFIERNGKQDKPSIGHGEDVNSIFYNQLFVLEDPSITSSILELFDNDILKIFNKGIEDSDWFPIKDEKYYLDVIRHVPFLSYKYKARSVLH